jgi:hypothetical protein
MSNRFVVDLGDLKLDAAAKLQVANAIQGAVLGELAKLDAASSAGPFAVFDPVKIKNPRWYGIWIKKLVGNQGIPSLEADVKEIEQFARGG